MKKKKILIIAAAAEAARRPNYIVNVAFSIMSIRYLGLLL